jgi:hypothetical protein
MRLASGFPCALCFGGITFMHPSGKTGRENANLSLLFDS